MAMLKVENVHKDFSGLQVLVDVNMEVAEGERHAIIWPNGAGKSTLFNLITGYYKPSEGKIFFDGRDITHRPIHKIARMILSRSFQIINIFPMITVYQNVRNAIVSKFNHRFNWFRFLDRSEEIREESEKVSRDLKDRRSRKSTKKGGIKENCLSKEFISGNLL